MTADERRRARPCGDAPKPEFLPAFRRFWRGQKNNGAGFAGEWPRSAADWLSGGIPHLCLEPLDNPDNQDLDVSFTPLSDAEYRQHAEDINTMARSFWAARCQRSN